MEEIFLDLSQVPMSQEDLASLEEIISRSFWWVMTILFGNRKMMIYDCIRY